MVQANGQRMPHQPSRRLEQVLDGNQAVVPQGPTRSHKINNRFRHPCDRPQLHRTIEMHQLDRKIECIEIFPGAVREFAGYPAMGREICGTGVTTALLNRHGHSATAKAKIHQLGDGELMFLEPVSYTHLTLPTIYSV